MTRAIENCPTCHRPTRERGEVRVHVWACGCPVRPTVEVVTVGVLEERRHRARGHGVTEDHPTEAGAIAAWRTALERRQREDDEAAARTPRRWEAPFVGSPSDRACPVVDGEDEVSHSPVAWRSLMVGHLQRKWAREFAERHGFAWATPAPDASPDEFTQALNAEIERAIIGDAGREVFGYALADSTPDPENPGQHLVTVAVGAGAIEQAARAKMDARLLAREREAMVLDAEPKKVSVNGQDYWQLVWGILEDENCDDGGTEVRHAVRACTEATHVETLVAVANECARRWPGYDASFSVDTVEPGRIMLTARVGRWVYDAAEVVDIVRRIAGVA